MKLWLEVALFYDYFKIVKTLIAGTFDNFHVGHQWLIWSAAQKGTNVVIIVARDKTVKRIKKITAKNNETQRIKRVATEVLNHKSLKVRLGRSDGDFWHTIAEEQPDLILLGYDQHVKEADILKHFPGLKIERCSAYKPKLFKSSKF